MLNGLSGMQNMIMQPTPLLIVEDSDEDYTALSRVFRKLGIVNPVRRCENGDACLDYLEQTDKNTSMGKTTLPGLILLDLNLPGTDGRDVLRSLKVHPRFKSIPVTVLTTSANPRDVAACYNLGVNAYVLKPLDYDDLTETLRRVMDFWLYVVIFP